MFLKYDEEIVICFYNVENYFVFELLYNVRVMYKNNEKYYKYFNCFIMDYLNLDCIFVFFFYFL